MLRLPRLLLVPLCFWQAVIIWTVSVGTVLASDSDATRSPTTVQHALGETTIRGKPARVISLYQGATDTAVALGIEPVGVVESWTEQPMYHYLRDHVGDPDYLGLETQPDLERIAWLAPDLIVGAQYRHRTIYPLLTRIAPTVIPGEVFDFKALLKLTAKASGRQDRGEQLLAQWQARVNDFRAQIQQKLGERWPQEVAILSFRADHARIYYDGFARTVLRELGFEAPEAHRKDSWGIKLTSQESIPAMDAQAVFVFMEDDAAVHHTYDSWTRHPLWQNLQAVRKNEVYQVDPVIWNMGGGIIAANRMLDDLYEHYGLAPSDPGACPPC
tara:strand:+ start:2077 stop:3063 length:987 start_codon:yes stop_codon:yes gene_type:complete